MKQCNSNVILKLIHNVKKKYVIRMFLGEKCLVQTCWLQ